MAKKPISISTSTSTSASSSSSRSRVRVASTRTGSTPSSDHATGSKKTLIPKESRSALGRFSKRPRLASAKSKTDMRANNAPTVPVSPGASKKTETLKPKASLSPQAKTAEGKSEVMVPPVLDADALAKLDALAGLLDLSAISSHNDIQLRFGQIARMLIHDFVIVVTLEDGSRTEYELLEVEFYLRKPGHDDPFAHGAHEQKTTGNWYFHRMKTVDPATTSTPGYKGGTRKGLDLTFGSPIVSPHFQDGEAGAATHGGILIRALRRIDDDTVFAGPSTLVDEILRAARAPTVPELINDYLAGNTNALRVPPTGVQQRCTIVFEPRPKPKLNPDAPRRSPKPVVHFTTRVGLDLANQSTRAESTDPRVIFVQKPYRFLVHPALTATRGRGAVQTVLGLYCAIAEAEILSDAGVLDECARLSGIARATVERYVSDYKRGMAEGTSGPAALEAYVGARGKGVSAQPAAWCTMMGVLAAISARGQGSR